jgi:hypothetical protein
MRLVLAFALLLLPASYGEAQELRVTAAAAELHAAPDGARLASLAAGTPLRGGATRGAWREVTIEAWVWAASLRAERRDGHDLAVQAAAGENLRTEPNGTILGRAHTGMRFSQVQRRAGWVLVRRTAWIPVAAVAAPAGATPPAAAPPDATPTAAPGTAPAAAPPAAGAARIGPGGAVVLAAPRGDTLARLRPLAGVEVLGREGEWTRVRIEGWIRSPAVHAVTDTAAFRDATAADLAAAPEAFRGRTVHWTVQYISLERAEAIRTDFQEGEPFLLARGPGDERGFVYIAVPPELLPAARGLVPLQRVTVLARVRYGRSPLMGAPVLELIDLVP